MWVEREVVVILTAMTMKVTGGWTAIQLGWSGPDDLRTSRFPSFPRESLRTNAKSDDSPKGPNARPHFRRPRASLAGDCRSKPRKVLSPGAVEKISARLIALDLKTRCGLRIGADI